MVDPMAREEMSVCIVCRISSVRDLEVFCSSRDPFSDRKVFRDPAFGGVGGSLWAGVFFLLALWLFLGVDLPI